MTLDAVSGAAGGRQPVVEFSYGHGEGTVSAVYAPRRVTIRDARGLRPSLDVEGFTLVRRPTSTDFSSEDEIVGLGDWEASKLVADVTGAARVFVFDHTLRRRAPDAVRQPSTRVPQ